MNVVNMTPHTITVVRPHDPAVVVAELLPFGAALRLQEEKHSAGDVMINGEKVPLTYTMFLGCEGLPEERSDTFLIVSRLVAQAFPDRSDLLVPTGLVRDKDGVVRGCTGFDVA